MTSDVTGEVETEDGVLVVKRIHVAYTLELEQDQVEAAQRAHEAHHGRCPVYKTIRGCVDITTELRLVVS